MKYTYNIIIRTAAVIAAVLTISSCLEKYPKDMISEDEAMTSLEGAEQIVTGIYAAYMSGALYSGYLTLAPDIQADMVLAVEGNSNTYGEIYQWIFRPTNAEIESVYAGLYTVIGRCNFYLDQVDALRATLQSDEHLQTLDQYTGEVHCARALAYSELAKCFCEAYDKDKADTQLGVVLRSSYFKAEPVVRASLAETYGFIIKDLEKAEELLDEEGNAYGAPYFTLGAVQAIRARVALYMEDWDKAIEYSGKVIDNDAYDLATSSVYTTGTDPISGESRSYTYIDYMWTHDLSWENIWQIGFTATSYGGGLGQIFLNYNIDYYYFYPDYMPSSWVVSLYGTSDARRTAYFRTVTTGYPGNPALTLLTKYFGNESTFIPLIIYHVCQPKPVRLAEQYLIRAEAYCRKDSPNLSLANADLSTLRQTRGVSGKSLSASNWMEIISEERVKELYMEGFRLQDLKRWNMGFERTSQSSAQKEGSTLKIEAGDPRFVWPIPKHEIEAPGSQIQGNASNYL